MTQSDANDESILLELLKIALDAGADRIEAEYEDRKDVVYAFKGNMGISIAAFPANSPESQALRNTLWKRKRKRKTSKVEIDGVKYTLNVETFESFDETVFRVSIQKV